MGDLAQRAHWLVTLDSLHTGLAQLAADSPEPPVKALLAETRSLAEAIFQAAREKRLASNEAARRFRHPVRRQCAGRGGQGRRRCGRAVPPGPA